MPDTPPQLTRLTDRCKAALKELSGHFAERTMLTLIARLPGTKEDSGQASLVVTDERAEDLGRVADCLTEKVPKKRERKRRGRGKKGKKKATTKEG